jgi:hypothetical protein
MGVAFARKQTKSVQAYAEKPMSPLHILTLNRLSSVALRSEFCSLKLPHWSKYLPFDEGSFLPPGHERSDDLFFSWGKMGGLRKTSLLPILKRGMEV